MKKCLTCGLENTDTMRFCVECGSTLPDAPIIVNFGGGNAGQQNPFGNSPQAQSGGKGNFGSNFPNQFSNVPQAKPRTNKKTFLIIGGILALFLLVFAAGAAVIGYNMLLKDEVVNNPTPNTSPTTNASVSPTKTPKSPTPSNTNSSSNTNSTSNSITSTDGKAELGRVWVDYNVTQGGKKGMLIHVKFTVRKMKNVDSYLAAYFEKDNGEKLFTNNKAYRSTEGQVAVFKALRPAYDDTVYDDEKLFIPYDEFNLDSGSYDLQAVIDVIYENGNLVSHMDTHEFEYTEP
jgi:hypothetical protein